MMTIQDRTETRAGMPAPTRRWDMEYMTVTAKTEGRRYIAIYRKSFNEKLGAWELEIVPGTMRWLD
jgi:hypothetical protein